MVAMCVEKLWSQYDKDGSGMLDKDEAKVFIMSTLADMGAADAQFSDEDYDACFLEFDVDGSGQISKGEMTAFIKKVAGI